jgi:5-methylcytosine-specific restriction enzyme subunit McrC
MKLISIFEHECFPEQEQPSESEKIALDGLRGPCNEKMFAVGWKKVKATSFVGVVQLGKRVIQVLPKMYSRQLDVERNIAECGREATANLLFLLNYTGKLRVTEPEIARLTEKSAPLSEILYWIFARRLWEGVRRELLRGYISVEERLNLIKGRWLVAAQAQRSDGWRRDRFDVAYDEFTEDNLPNRLFNATVLRLSRWATWSDTRSHLAQLRSAFADVSEIIPRPRDFPEAAQWMQRYRRRAGDRQLYRPLLEMARMFWAGAGPQPSPGRVDSFAFMFDMNELFEEFIAESIRRELREVWQEQQGWDMRVQKENRACLWYESRVPRFWLHPDVRFVDELENSVLIIDTKYKELKADRQKWVSDEDARQMYAYSRRFDCPRVVLLYPQFAEKIAVNFSADADSPPWFEVRTVDLRRNLIREKTQLREELVCTLLPVHNMEIES